ncbi:WXG100 family type VII secretion target [Saccharopolyspora cebuensis]|uniref:WXG100 family type VII secretion target n=1 Tax=Saccharopolyspora cebuensis TaxID=418759 RepID=A0ABV4CHB2_9PSEU
MADEMEMQPEEVRSGGAKIGAAGGDLDGVLNTLRSALEAEGECWGTDEAGEKFGKEYTKGRDDLFDALEKTVKALGDIDDNLKGTADDTETRDLDSAVNIGRSGQVENKGRTT